MTLDYQTIKHVHLSAAGLSLALFVLRGAWRAVSPERLAARWVRVVPHVIDTVLLASALWLAWQVGSGAAPWITAKVVALLAYIVLGSFALKRGRTPGIRAAAFFAALATFGYIVSVAIAKSPWGALARL
ncbi:MAG: SirB2 family protein [Betaproteobacteria bacterium]|nr:SirB2 family protein [Betaproteobacteria bacterium]